MNPRLNCSDLAQKASWVRRETIRLHGLAPETRLASSLSDVEIFACLYYGGILAFDPSNPSWQGRDRLVVSKGHGAVSLYPILADLGFIDRAELDSIARPGSRLAGIPDCAVPGIETINGSLGHGLGVATGIALAMKQNGSTRSVFVVGGDGELYEGSVWESVMFLGHRGLNNIVFIVDNNRISLLDYCRTIIDLEPVEKKFEVFRWDVFRVDGHDVRALNDVLLKVSTMERTRPVAIVADTVKGKGVARLETDPLCHIRTLSQDEVSRLVRGGP